MELGEVLVAVAQVAAGGTIVQGVVAFVRRRSELRQLDRAADSVAVDTADKMIVMLRGELEATKQQAARDSEAHAGQLADLRRQVLLLGEEVSRLRAELVIAGAEIQRLKGSGR